MPFTLLLNTISSIQYFFVKNLLFWYYNRKLITFDKRFSSIFLPLLTLETFVWTRLYASLHFAPLSDAIKKKNLFLFTVIPNLSNKHVQCSAILLSFFFNWEIALPRVSLLSNQSSSETRLHIKAYVYVYVWHACSCVRCLDTLHLNDGESGSTRIIRQ